MVVLGLRSERCHLSHDRTENGERMNINGYEILAAIPAAPSGRSGRPEMWYLVGLRSDTEAVCAITYDLTGDDWSQGFYVDLDRTARPGDAYRRALEIAKEKAGLVEAARQSVLGIMNSNQRSDELLVELELLVDQCRDEHDPDFFHAANNGAYFAGAFDELNVLLREGAALPTDWSQK